MASSQIELFNSNNLDNSSHMSKIISEVLTPENLAPDYPLSYANSEPLLWRNIPREDKIDRLYSMDHINYRYMTEVETDRSWTFAKKLTILTSLIADTFVTNLGLEGDANPNQIRFRYWDPANPCSNVNFLYPANINIAAVYSKGDDEDECNDRASNIYDNMKDNGWKSWSEIYSTSDGFRLQYLAKIFDDSEFAGFHAIQYDIEVLNRIISPLYQTDDTEEQLDVNLFIYANEIDITRSIVLPSYDKPVYQKSVIDLPEADFQTNIDNLFVETVFTSEINGEEYRIYSQAVPATATEISEVQFYLFFLLKKENAPASE